MRYAELPTEGPTRTTGNFALPSSYWRAALSVMAFIFPEGNMIDVFISFSRKDQVFVRKLHDALEERKKKAWVDDKDIPLTATWKEELYFGIESSHNFVYVMSPDSVVSQRCKQELDYAVENKKRIVPIYYRDMDNRAVPPDLTSHQYIFFGECEDFDRSLDSLSSCTYPYLYDTVGFPSEAGFKPRTNLGPGSWVFPRSHAAVRIHPRAS